MDGGEGNPTGGGDSVLLGEDMVLEGGLGEDGKEGLYQVCCPSTRM